MLVRYDLSPDVIAITETWLNTSSFFQPFINGYNYVNGYLNKRIGGVGMFIKESIKYKVLNEFSLNTEATEELWIELSPHDSSKMLYSVIYRHPHAKLCGQFKTAFEDTIFKLNSIQKNYFIFGDFNIDLCKDSSKDYIDSLLYTGCKQLVKFITHPNPKESSIIDHIYTNCENKSQNVYYLKEDITDHFPILLTIDCFKSKNHKNTIKIMKRNMTNFSESKFSQELYDKLKIFHNDIRRKHSDKDINLLFNRFINIFQSVVDNYAPLRPISRKKAKLKHKPWITKGILKSIRTKNKLFKQSLKYKNQISCFLYKNYRNLLTQIINASKKIHYSKFISKSTNKPKLLWKNINNILQYKSLNTKNIESIRDSDNILTQDPLEIGNTMNTFFSSIGTNLGKSCTPVLDDDYPENVKFHNNNFFLQPMSNSEVLQILSNIDTNKSNPPDDPPNYFIKLAKSIITPVLTDLINLVFKTGTFPDKLKFANIIPIHKANDEELACNYRPISLLSIFSKILEKCIYLRMNSFLCKYSILHPNQFGFRTGLSTEHAVSVIYNNYVENLEKSKSTCSIFLDIKKAFDSVDHAILLCKLYRYGFRGPSFELLTSFLSNRFQCVSVQGVKSDLQPVTCGVPQGSVLGPLLFILFINDLPLVSTFKTTLFADDACLSISHSSLNSLETKVNTELNKISNWFKKNKLCLNYKKTCFIIITRKKQEGDFKIYLDNKTIVRSHKVKYLGIIFDDKLNWEDHIKIINSKISKGCYAIIRLRPYVNIKTLLQIYYALVYTHLQYCVTSWGAAAPSHTKKIITKQKKILRLMTYSSFNSHSDPLFKSLKILKIEDILNLKTAMDMYVNIKFDKENSKNPTNNKLIPLHNFYKYNTRSKADEQYYVPSVSKNIGKTTLNYLRPYTWNKIPLHIRNSKSLILFKKNYKEHLLIQYND